MKEEIPPGQIVIVDNFIDRTHKRSQTFYDGNEQSLIGVMHIPMEPAFCNRTRKILIDTAKNLGINVTDHGTVVTIEGPRFSSRAESNLFRSWGADLVNMTLVPEVVLAKEIGMCYAAIAVATDYDCWRDCGEKVSVPEVIAMFKKNVEKVMNLLLDAVPLIAKQDWTDTINELRETVNQSNMMPHS